MNQSYPQFIDLLGALLKGDVAVLPDADWQRLFEIAKANRMLPLLHAAIREMQGIPPSISQALMQEAQRSFVATTLTTRVLQPVADALLGIDWVLLRGPVLGQMLYHDLMLRPYGDLDVLVAPAQVDAALERLREAGFCQPASAFPDSYYRRYHLHIALERPGLAGSTALELHWAIDHPFALFTLEVESLLDRRTTLAIDGISIPCLALEDLIIALAIHAVKHAALLPLWIDQSQPAALAEHGMLLHFYDIALAITHLGDQIDWPLVADRSRAWGAADQVALCLQTIEMLWHIPAPIEGGSPELPAWRRQVLKWSSDKNAHSSFAQLRGAFFRPIRLVDTVSYMLPPRDYLIRRYGHASLMQRVSHMGHAFASLGGGALELGYLSLSAWRRHLQRGG